MVNFIKKALYSGIGTVYLTKEKVGSTFKNIAEYRKTSESAGKKFMDNIHGTSSQTIETIEFMVKKHIDSALKRLDIPTKHDLNRINDRLHTLEENSKPHE